MLGAVTCAVQGFSFGGLSQRHWPSRSCDTVGMLVWIVLLGV
jgi:hypothetical protein